MASYLRKIIINDRRILVMCMVFVCTLSGEIPENDKLTKSQDICLLASSSGPCFAYFERWYYNSTAKKCDQFVYGGCEGNSNNFESRRECEAKCSMARTKRQPKPKGPCAEKLAKKPLGLIGTFIPQCDKDGYYKHKQCWGSVGSCWCVYRTGRKVLLAEEKSNSQVELDCDYPCAKAYKKALQTVLVRGVPIPIQLPQNQYFPSCDEEGYYKPKQCHSGKCWCVDGLGAKVPGNGTSTDPDKLSCE